MQKAHTDTRLLRISGRGKETSGDCADRVNLARSYIQYMAELKMEGHR